MRTLSSISLAVIVLLILALVINQAEGEKSLDLAGNAKVTKIQNNNKDGKVATTFKFGGEGAMTYSSQHGLLADATEGAKDIGAGLKGLWSALDQKLESAGNSMSQYASK